MSGTRKLFLLDRSEKRLIQTTDEREDEVVDGRVGVGAPQS